MKSILFASAIALTTVLSTASVWASDNGMRPGDRIFGTAVEMTMGGHTMHVRAIKDKDGGQWVVLPRDEFETMIGHSVDLTFNAMPDGH